MFSWIYIFFKKEVEIVFWYTRICSWCFICFLERLGSHRTTRYKCCGARSRVLDLCSSVCAGRSLSFAFSGSDRCGLTHKKATCYFTWNIFWDGLLFCWREGCKSLFYVTYSNRYVQLPRVIVVYVFVEKL